MTWLRLGEVEEKKQAIARYVYFWMRLFYLQLRSFCLWFVLSTYGGGTVSKQTTPNLKTGGTVSKKKTKPNFWTGGNRK